MTLVLLDSQALRLALAEQRTRLDRQIKVREHPYVGGPPMLLVTGRTRQADEAVQSLAERFGSARWDTGRWQVRRPQLRLPGI